MHALRGSDLQVAVVELAQRGLRPIQISERLGRRPGTIASTLSDARAAGVLVPKFRPGPVPGSLIGRQEAAEARARGMAAMVMDGLTPRDVAVRVGTTASAVSVALSRLRSVGVQVPLGKPGRPKAA